ncbi:MAG TPA: nicotinate phosphoribosyltransferase, partial [Acidimicrobiales bacterium]|nr:nicotinate phosphoribosyltransferase [Acidimicrobiales bacterium]
IELVEFGMRRTHGIEAADAAARAAALVGFVATSNVEAARRYGVRPAGTMAHAYVEAFPSEVEAFRAYAHDHPHGVTLLVDTYDLLPGVGHAITVLGELGLDHGTAVRIDSGDLATVTPRVRGMLDEAGLGGVRIFVSGGIDEHDLAALVAAGAPVDAAGVGTRLGTSADAPYLDSAYKLVAVGDRPVMKLSPGKATLPGAKQVFRASGLVDTIALRHETPPPGSRPLLEPVMAGGRRLVPGTDPARALVAAGRRFRADLDELPPAARALVAPVAPVPARSPALEELTARTEARVRRGAGVR